jgi:hypothetical protein
LGLAPVFSPAAAHFLFPSPTSRSPSPHWASASRPAQPALSAQPAESWWCPARLLPLSRGNTSPRAAFTPLRAQLTGGPYLSSLSSSSARAWPRHHHSAPRDAAPVPLLPPTINPPLNPSLCHLAFNGIKDITVGRFFTSPGRSPPPSPYKRARSTPGHHHTDPRSPLLAPESATPTSPSTDRRRRFPPSPGHLAAARPPVRPLTGSLTPTPRPPPLPQ